MQIKGKNIWLIGCPRSGTTCLTEHIGQYVDHVYNEPWDTHPINEPTAWQFPPGSKIFKYCENWRNAAYIMRTYPDSIFIHVWRDPDNVIHSMSFPKPDAYPSRDLYASHKKEEKVKLCIQRWYDNMTHCLNLDCYPYLEIQYEKTAQGLSELGLPDLKFTNRNIKTNIDWSCNQAAKRLRDHIKNYDDTNLAKYIKSKNRIFS